MRILVTGSEGNIGQYLVRDLQQHYPTAHIYRVRENEKSHSYRSMQAPMLFEGDLKDSRFVSNVVFKQSQPTHVIHLAARLYGVAGFNNDIFGIYSNDMLCLLNVLRCCRDVEKVVYFSSSMVYESCGNPPFEETDTLNCLPPVSSYGMTKLAGERAVQYLFQQHGVPYTIWRPFNVVSPLESHERTEGHVFVDFFRKIFVEKNMALPVYGSGKQVRCFTWVEDVTATVARLLVVSATNGEIYNIGSDEQTTLEELAELFVELGKELGALPQDFAVHVMPGDKFFGVDVEKRVPSLKKIRQFGWSITRRRECFERFLRHKLAM